MHMTCTSPGRLIDEIRGRHCQAMVGICFFFQDEEYVKSPIVGVF